MSATLAVKVVPGASRSKVAGWLGLELKLRISAPPDRDKANKSVERLLAKRLGLAPKQVNIVKGLTSTHKKVEFQGISQAELVTAFGKPATTK
ncbi:MAG: DUF167 domain-containing protein [Proteobacteria bacterium]|nr:DUF167 domain-containing protein [Pseudomonadota bacterium]